jgi:PKD repeat protein
VGCIDTAMSQVVVLPQPIARMANSSILSSCSGNGYFYLKDSSVILSATISSRKWEISNGMSFDSSVAYFKIDTVGKHNVKLVVQAKDGCYDTAEAIIDVRETPVSSVIVLDTALCIGDSFHFMNNAVTASGAIVSHNWKFGDGVQSNTENFSKTYTTHGEYVVSLEVENDLNCKDTSYTNIKVFPSPVAKIVIDGIEKCFKNQSFNFYDSSSIPNGSIVGRFWDFGDGNSSSVQNVSYNYSTVGVYDLKLKVISDKGCETLTTLPLKVLHSANADFMVDFTEMCLKGNQFNFSDLSTSTNNIITNRIWQFGDGTTSNITNPTKSFSSNGNYQVRLVALSSDNCRDTAIKTITVFQSPKADAILGPFVAYTGDASIKYIALPLQNHSYNWLITNGKIISGQGTRTVFAEFHDTGLQTISLVLTNNSSCSDTVSLNVFVKDYNSIGLNNTEFQNLMVYPNPVANTLYIQSSHDFKKYKITDMKGAVRYEGGFSTSLNVASLSVGAYLLYLIDDNGRSVIYKFIKE